MPKYEIEIPDGVLPEGYVPVAYRKPERGDPYVNPFHSQQVSANGGGDMSKVEPRLIVEKRPEPKFKVGDYALLNNEAVIILSDRQRGITLDGKEGSPRYIVRPAKGDDLSVTEESLTLVDPPKFKVGDWVKNTGNGSSVHAITRVKWWDWGKVWWYVLDNNTGSTADYLKPTTRVPLTQDDAVKLALGEITPKDIQLEDKWFERSLAKHTVKALSKQGVNVMLRFNDTGEPMWDTYYPISDLTRLV